MGFVMVHPDLPGQPIDVLDGRAIEIHERGGWRLADEAQRPAVTFDPGPPPPDGYVEIYHPVSRASAHVAPESLTTYRASGWLLAAEHAANEESAAEQAAAAKTKSAAKAAASKEE